MVAVNADTWHISKHLSLIGSAKFNRLSGISGLSLSDHLPRTRPLEPYIRCDRYTSQNMGESRKIKRYS